MYKKICVIKLSENIFDQFDFRSCVRGLRWKDNANDESSIWEKYEKHRGVVPKIDNLYENKHLIYNIS